MASIAGGIGSLIRGESIDLQHEINGVVIPALMRAMSSMELARGARAFSGLPRRCSRSACADPCPDSEAVFARGTNEHRKLHRPREARACPVAKRHQVKPIAAGH
ncbi:MAG: hypothetical protein ACREOE_11555, partial [Gemmatimonadales bacterium]